MNCEEVKGPLNLLFVKWTQLYFPLVPDLVGVLQFGSTVRPPLKHQTDLDLFLVFKTLPKNRMEQFNLTLDLEHKLNQDLKSLVGYNIEVSFILRAVSQLDHLSSFNLDFIDCSKIWYDPNGVLAALMTDIKNWIQQNGSYKVKKGNLWYWVYSKVTKENSVVSFKFKK